MASSKSLPTSTVAAQVKSASALESNLRLNQTAPIPALKANQTLVKILSASINPIDYKISEIPYLSSLAVGFPFTPATDYVGRVWATTLPESEGIKDGDLVFGRLDGPAKNGTLAEFCVVPGKNGIAKAPSGVDLDHLAAIGVAASTAYQSLVNHIGKDGRGKAVFINGGSGGTGTFGIQIAKKGMGCTVVTSCSGSNVGLCQELGADKVIDYRSQDLATELKRWIAEKNGGQKFDLIVDNAGMDARLYYDCHDYLKEGAKYVQVGASLDLASMKRLLTMMIWPSFLGGGKRKYGFLALSPDKDTLVTIGQWMKEGKVKALIDDTFSLNDAGKAFQKLKTGRTRGKIVVRVSEDGR